MAENHGAGNRLEVNRFAAISIVERSLVAFANSSVRGVGNGVGLGKALGVGTGLGVVLGDETGVGVGRGSGSPTRRPFLDCSGLRRERMIEGTAFGALGAGSCRCLT